MKPYNFFAGPAILAEEVLKTAEKAVNNFEGMNLSVLEISHRSNQFVSVMDEAEQLVRELLHVGEEYSVLFLTGGASSQFYMTAMNLLGDKEKAGYLNTGAWSKKAIVEANKFGEIVEVASSKNEGFNNIPKGYAIDNDLKYLHLTSNNTIFGTEIHKLPETSVPIVADMSSNIFSRAIELDRYDLIYAGAQKNLGPAGTTLVIVKKSKLNRIERDIPSMLNYQTHVDKQSSFNTPPVYPIYVSMLTLRWIKKNGGVAAMEARNIKKAQALYAEIDRNGLFEGTAKKEDRSRMNVCFVCKNKELENDFLNYAESKNLVGLKGHRSVGGFRASIYNAMPDSGVDALIKAMEEFEQRNA